MQKKILLLIIILLFSEVKLCHALEWKALHEEADKKSLPEALTAVQDNPTSEDALYTLGLIYLNLHEDRLAEEAFTKLDPGTPEAKWGKAEVLRRGHDLTKSEQILAGIIKSGADFTPAYISLAYIKYTNLDFVESLRLAYKVIARGKDKSDLSNFVRAYLIVAGSRGMLAHYGGLFSKIVNGTKAKPYLNKAERLAPDSPAVLLAAGSYYLLAPPIAGGDIDKAKDYLGRAIKTDPLLIDAYVRLAQVYLVKGDKEKYSFYLNKALEIDPKSELANDIKSGECKFICAGK